MIKIKHKSSACHQFVSYINCKIKPKIHYLLKYIQVKYMKKYFDTLNDEVKDYFKILSLKFPNWLLDYINALKMQRIATISMSCGTDYSKCFNVKYWYLTTSR